MEITPVYELMCIFDPDYCLVPILRKLNNSWMAAAKCRQNKAQISDEEVAAMDKKQSRKTCTKKST